MSLNNFNKQLLTRYIDTECERQLLLDLSRVYPDKWYKDTRKIQPPKRIRQSTELLTKLGKEYEQKVYKKLIRLPEAKYNLSSKGNVSGTYLNPKLFVKIYEDLKKSPLEDFLLLEYQYDVPESFFKELFPPKGKKYEIPVNYGDQRPDLMIIGNSLNDYKENIRELLPNGEIQQVSKRDLAKKFGINVIDIKNIREDKIGKKQFAEIFYYMHTLAHYLESKKLMDKFYVRIDFNGILPQLDKKQLKKIKSLEILLENIILIKWEESYQIYADIITNIKKMWYQAPHFLENTQVNIQPNCGYCYYVEDCQITLGMDGTNPPSDWSVRLIPYTSASIAQRLIELKYETVGDIAKNIEKIKVGNTPEPLYAEMPLLKLKAEALIKGDKVLPEDGYIHAYSIPKYSPIALNFAIEADPANQRVYAAGFFLDITVTPKVPYAGIFNAWWMIWKEAIDQKTRPKEIRKKLNQYLIKPIPLVIVEQFLATLSKLDKLIILLKGEKTKSGKKRKLTRVIYQFAIVNEGLEDKKEAEFTKEIIVKLFNLMQFCNILENYVVVDGYTAGTYYGPSTSILYWSKRQLDNFQDMLERVLEYIVDDPEIWGNFSSVISYFTPSDSEVSHPYQHKKLFDIQDFAETIIGFPSIISYTWHEIAKKELGTLTGSKFWMPHFNYMDYNNWYEMLEAPKPEKPDLKKEIRRQIMHKVRTINQLRRKFQIESNYTISKNARVISKAKFKDPILPLYFHSIAQVWYMFSKLTGAREEMDTEYYRTVYPELSIGKLEAAKVSNLRKVNVSKKKCYYSFQITELSSNMKLSEKDRILLIPDEKR
ncbi:MAG: hypothetical protein EU521_00865, partial [Promethearchaeota archaeon]